MNIKKPFFKLDLSVIKETKWLLIAGVVAAVFLLTAVLNLVVFPSKTMSSILRPIVTGTHGLVNGTLIAYIFLFIVIVFGIIIFTGKLSSRDIGINWKSLPQALLVTCILCFATQIIGLVFSLLFIGKLTLAAQWQSAGLTASLGIIISQFFGCAPVEEIVFRGFLLPQLFIKFKSQRLQLHPLLRLLTALIISQLIFALFHIPSLISKGVPLDTSIVELVKYFTLGILISLIYLRTGNLFIGIGIHALFNLPASLFTANITFAYISLNSFICICLILILFLVWPRFMKSYPGRSITKVSSTT